MKCVYRHDRAPLFERLSTNFFQAAWGLEYLHAKNVLHRDIAARNCLYGDNKVKISDFGLTREGTVYQMDPHKRVPIRWLAPETLRMAIYTQKTDVFSYGIMCWEIYNNGIEPYPGMTVAEVNQNEVITTIEPPSVVQISLRNSEYNYIPVALILLNTAAFFGF
ncbi:hypothetical protein Y032_0010g1131 [Ancylostoma ceylanicum]|uniref:Protein kinase domain-containing protein n=1 Tax=Ancylostoma ceylanicum TaxID=53326 RepID=A0A016VG50_9BILA|nr:hypothetical protein Y032_0010g1131 [Ancylostoma ceylanicum]